MKISMISAIAPCTVCLRPAANHGPNRVRSAQSDRNRCPLPAPYCSSTDCLWARATIRRSPKDIGGA